jgi:hypothetical protein
MVKSELKQALRLDPRRQRGRKCWDCLHLLDYYPKSTWPISCGRQVDDDTNCRPDGTADPSVLAQQFPEGKIREDADCPYFEGDYDVGYSTFRIEAAAREGVIPSHYKNRPSMLLRNTTDYNEVAMMRPPK